MMRVGYFLWMLQVKYIVAKILFVHLVLMRKLGGIGFFASFEVVSQAHQAYIFVALIN